jgi:hypothetical protein
VTPGTLQFVHSTVPPTADVDVYADLVTDLLGAPFQFCIVGSSHFVSSPALEFYELSSCEPVAAEGAVTLDLEASGSETLTHETDSLQCETFVDRRPLSAFPGPEPSDLAYRFDEDAVTTVALSDDGYETYHTYPEFDLALYTETRFLRVDSPPGTRRSSVARGGPDAEPSTEAGAGPGTGSLWTPRRE